MLKYNRFGEVAIDGSTAGFSLNSGSKNTNREERVWIFFFYCCLTCRGTFSAWRSTILMLFGISFFILFTFWWFCCLSYLVIFKLFMIPYARYIGFSLIKRKQVNLLSFYIRLAVYIKHKVLNEGAVVCLY